MKHFLFPAVFALLLTSCGQSSTLSYDVEFKSNDRNRMANLTLATKRIVTRRLRRFDSNLLDYDVDYGEGTASISIEVDNAKAANALDEEMLAPLVLEIRTQVEEALEGDIEVEGQGFFRASTISSDDFDWVVGGKSQSGPNGQVTLIMTDEGSENMKKIFADHQDESIGLFLRGRLTALFTANGENFEQSIVIPNVPTEQMAEIFADDMNVGIHMKFQKK
ncbi:MAG: hypothetical protein QF442_01290 [Candidatus Peribacteraceae bacterium]|jgi:hypothetical protein|nr:hypothetical protein [Candidatus Peribacteraceae bacterium]